MSTDAVWWALSALMIVAGLAGAVLPALPGTALVLAGIVLGAWIDDFTRVGAGTLAIVTALAVLSWVLEYVAGLLGAKRAGASRQALAPRSAPWPASSPGWSACCSCRSSAPRSASTWRSATTAARCTSASRPGSA